MGRRAGPGCDIGVWDVAAGIFKFILLRLGNANKFALLSASAYICPDGFGYMGTSAQRVGDMERRGEIKWMT